MRCKVCRGEDWEPFFSSLTDSNGNVWKKSLPAYYKRHNEALEVLMYFTCTKDCLPAIGDYFISLPPGLEIASSEMTNCVPPGKVFEIFHGNDYYMASVMGHNINDNLSLKFINEGFLNNFTSLVSSKVFKITYSVGIKGWF